MFNSTASPVSTSYGWSVTAAGGFPGNPEFVIVVGDRARDADSYVVSVRSSGVAGGLSAEGIDRSYFYGAGLALRDDAKRLVITDPGGRPADPGQMFVWNREGRLDDFALEQTIEAPDGVRSFGRAIAMASSTAELFVSAYTVDGVGVILRMNLDETP